VEPFTLPDKIYGNLTKRADRIRETFLDRDNSTGVLLLGEKGSGKTLLGKQVAIDLYENHNQPCIIVNKPLSGDALGTFLQRLNRPVTVFLDEFEKVYDKNDQEAMLTVLDGVYPMKLMAILTANSSERMIAPLRDRPGRVFYSITYTGLEYQFVVDYAKENLKDQSQMDEISRLAAMTELNFDQLQALIEEMNRFDESVLDAIQYLNISLQSDEQAYTVKALTVDGVDIPKDQQITSTIYLSPLDYTGHGEPSDDPYDAADAIINLVYMVGNSDHITNYELCHGEPRQPFIADPSEAIMASTGAAMLERAKKRKKTLSEGSTLLKERFRSACEFSQYKVLYRDYSENLDEVSKMIPTYTALRSDNVTMKVDGNMIVLTDPKSNTTVALQRGHSYNKKAF